MSERYAGNEQYEALTSKEKRDMAAIFYLADFTKEWKENNVEDLPPDISVLLMAFNAMPHNHRKTFLIHVADTYCLECGETDPPIDRPDDGKCRCYG